MIARNLVAAILTVLFANVTPAQTPTGMVEGTVVRIDTGEPIPGAQVTLAGLNISPSSVGPATIAMPPGASAPRPPTFPTISTGADGKFSFKDVRAGTYRVSATAVGFVNQIYGQRTFPGQGRPILLAAGESVRDATIRMTATGTISGRVFDENGQPALGAPVQLLRVAYSPQGKNIQVMGTSTADDRGDYRLFAMTPGSYFLVAGTPTGPQRGGSASAARYSMVYYPASPDFEHASTIEVRSAAESTVDMQVRRQTKTYRVHGRVVDSTGMGVHPNLDVSLGYKTFNSGGAFNRGARFDASTNTFEILNVEPGDYFVVAQPPRDRQVPVSPLAKAPIHVVDADIDGVVLNLSLGANASGHFVIEGQPLSALTNLQQMSLVFNAPDSQLPEELPEAQPTAADGTFQIVGLREGEYRIQLRGAPPAGIYLKSIHYDGEDILTKPLKFSGSRPGVFEVTFRSGAAQIAGTARNARAQTEPSVQVLLIPNNRNRTNDYRLALTDQTGRFQMSGIPPGEYKLFSWEAFDNNSVFNPEFVRQYEQRGTAVRVTEFSNQNIDVQVIAVP